MARGDRVLAGIVAGLVLLVAASILVVLSQPEPAYRLENLPEAVVHNYLLALRQADFERAYDCLAPSLAAYPSDATDFAEEVRHASGMYSLDENVAFDVTDVTIIGRRAQVWVVATRFSDGWLLEDGSHETKFEMSLQKNENSVWELIDSERYWLSCWDGGEPSMWCD
jgi:hypothetical protein